MIELGFPPLALAVALVAIATESATMRVVDAMAADAFLRDILESLTGMTAFAANFFVGAT